MTDMENPGDDELRALLIRARRIAVVGLSPDPTRPSHDVAAYLLRQGYDVIPVNPAVREVLGRRAYPDLAAVPGPVDIVNVFRRPEAVPEVADAAVGTGAGTLWLQLGVIHPDAARRARAAGLAVVMDRCLKVEHRRLLGPPSGPAPGVPGGGNPAR